MTAAIINEFCTSYFDTFQVREIDEYFFLYYIEPDKKRPIPAIKDNKFVYRRTALELIEYVFSLAKENSRLVGEVFH